MKSNERGIFIIRAVDHKRGKRSTQPNKDQLKKEHTKARLVFAQEAIIQKFFSLPQGLPAKRPRDLLKRVREALAQNPEWTKQNWEKPISRTHVKRAWEALQKL
jgi:hypothetical protein